MADRSTLKTYFETGDKPTEEQFAELVDSLYSLADDTSDNLNQGSTKLFLTAAERAKIAAFSQFGFMDYNDTTGAVSLVADTWTDVPNNGAGAFTNKTYKPESVTEIIDTTTGYLDFSDLTLGSEILVRNDFAVTPNTNNSLLEVRYLLGTGAGEYALNFWAERLDNGSGIPYQRVVSFPIYMGDVNTQGGPGKLQVRLSTPGSITNAGSYISIRVQ